MIFAHNKVLNVIKADFHRLQLSFLYIFYHRNVLCLSEIATSKAGQYYQCWLARYAMFKVRKRAKTRNRCNPAPHLTKDTIGKVTTTSQLDTTNESKI